MTKIVDERHCPQCGHGVMNWSMTCPGCDRVPWDTPAGRKILRRRRLEATFLSTGGLVGLFLIGVLGLMLWASVGTKRALIDLPKAFRQFDADRQQLFDNPSLSLQARDAILNRLAGQLKKDEPITGFLAASLLLKARDKRSIPYLIELLDSNEGSVSRFAQRFLRYVARDENFGYDRARWTQWWSEHNHEDLPSMDGVAWVDLEHDLEDSTPERSRPSEPAPTPPDRGASSDSDGAEPSHTGRHDL